MALCPHLHAPEARTASALLAPALFCALPKPILRSADKALLHTLTAPARACDLICSGTHYSMRQPQAADGENKSLQAHRDQVQVGKQC